MKIAVHITFFHIENRYKFLHEVIDNLLLIESEMNIFIYTNKKFKLFENYDNIKLLVYPYKSSIVSRFSFNSIFNKLGIKQLIHPYFLTWEHRKIVEENINEYDIQIYLEDDIKFTKDNLNYWLEFNEIVSRRGYNLGFLRIEFNGIEKYLTDVTKSLNKIIHIENTAYIVNEVNPYCGFWIYSKKELKEFIRSKEWNFDFSNYGIREKAAIGWHGKNMNRYLNTIIPLKEDDIQYMATQNCTVHHLPNNYLDHNSFCSLKFPIKILKKEQNNM